jgi:hypothetical protein
MRPALFVHIDADIYVSAYQALDWLCARRLLVAGSVVGYDDWLEPASGAPAEGEARAHAEVTAKYGLRWRRISGPWRARFPVHAWELLGQGST